MQALVLREVGAPLHFEERPSLQPAKGQVVVTLKAAALNHRDCWTAKGETPGTRAPVILGSDGAGVVTTVGTDVEPNLLGQKVVLAPCTGWGKDEAAQSEQFQILGMPEDGTFATEILVPEESVFTKPNHLNWQEAAALPLAGLTAWRALFSQGRLQAGEDVLITGIGGGVATLAMQFALAAGARVFVTSSSKQKLERAIELGAVAGFDYTDPDWSRQLKTESNAIRLVVDGAGGRGFAQLIQTTAPGGRIVTYGVTAGPPPELDLFKVFWKQLHLIGSTMGSPSDFARMLEFVSREKVHPVVDCEMPLEQGNDALKLMDGAQQFGKIILSMHSKLEG